MSIISNILFATIFIMVGFVIGFGFSLGAVFGAVLEMDAMESKDQDRNVENNDKILLEKGKRIPAFNIGVQAGRLIAARFCND